MLNFIKSAAVFILKSACFALVFSLIWLYIFRPPASVKNTEMAQAKLQTEAYERQINRVNHQMDVVDSQQKRMEKILDEQEKNGQRFGTVIEAWEKQTRVRK